MRNKFSIVRADIIRPLLTATLGLALAFTFGCSSESTNGIPEPTYFYSEIGIKNSSRPAFETLVSNAPENPSFEDIKAIWNEIGKLDINFFGSETGMTKSELKYMLVHSDVSPKEAEERIKKLNEKGNGILFFFSSSALYYRIVMYLERE